MKIWILDSDVDNYENVIMDGTPDLDFLSSFDGIMYLKNIPDSRQ